MKLNYVTAVQAMDLCIERRNEHFHLWNCLKEIPYFIVFISCIDVALYYMADSVVKRNLLLDLQNDIKLWRFFTYMFVHNDVIHLLINAVIRGISGVIIEREQGGLRCGIVYLCGGLAGGLGTAIFSPPVLMAGASAAIYALLMSNLPNIVLNYEAMNYVKYRISAVLFIVSSDVLHVVYHIWFFNNENPRIEWVAHVFGAFSGLTLGSIVFLGNHKFRRKIQIASLLICGIIVFVCCIHFNKDNLSTM